MKEIRTAPRSYPGRGKSLGAERLEGHSLAPDEDPIDALNRWAVHLGETLENSCSPNTAEGSGLTVARERLAQAREKLRKLREHVEIDTEQLKLPPEFALVSLRCKPSMRALLKSLRARRRMLQELASVAHRILAIQNKVLSHRHNSLYAYFYRQLVRRSMTDVEQKFKSLKVDDRNGRKILAAIFGLQIEAEDLQVNQVLLKALEDLHGSKRQAEKAKQELTRGETRLTKMQNWLKEQEFELAKATAFDFPFEIDKWPRNLRTQLGEVVKEGKQALQTYHVAQKFQNISKKRRTGPVLSRLISEEKP